MVRKNYFRKVKKLNLLYLLPALLLIFIFSPRPYSPLLAQLGSIPPPSVNDYQACQFFNPKVWDNDKGWQNFASSTPDKTPASFFNATCSVATMEYTATSGASFWLDKKWDYGELFIAFLLVLNLIIEIGLLVFSWFFEPVFKIRGGAKG